MAIMAKVFTIFAAIVTSVTAAFEASENATHYTLRNDRLQVAVAKSSGKMVDVFLDGQDLLGPTSGNSGTGPYLDCSCTPDGFWTPGSSAKLQLVKGTDTTGTPFGGIIMGDTYKTTNQSLYQYWFLREGETGLHMFSRVTYFNEKTPLLRDLGELRTLFRPNTNLWTHLSGSDSNWAPIPSKNATSNAVTVQDATTYLGNTPNDPYVKQYSDYFTKYSFAELWRDHDLHGQYSDGSTSPDKSTYGAWLVLNTKESYYGGPLHSDLVVDGIVYNYIVGGHHGAPVPNITHGFDRTFGPQFYHFNKGKPGTSLKELRADAAQYADPTWNAEFYDSIAKYVPNYVPSSKRTTFKARVELPQGAKRPIAVLSENKQDFQLNVFNQTSRQYWAEITEKGEVSIPRVVDGKYRLTIYADGIFGWFIQDDVVVSKSNKKDYSFQWKEESAGKEVWRIGTPDKSAGEYRHGFAPDTSKPLHQQQYRNYWAHWDFPSEFPDGVNFHVGKSREDTDFNYIHWSVFSGRANSVRPQPWYENVNNWTITFDLEKSQLQNAKKATFTVQVAGTKTGNGNNKWAGLIEKWSNLPWTVNINNKEEQTWVIPYWRSGSCGVRSAITCQNIENKFEFDASRLHAGKNEFVLSLPFNATNTETAVLPGTVYIQYDALRLEIA